jgi:hypothetical protein
MTPLRRKRLTITACLLGVILIALAVVLRSAPFGYFDSTTIMGHHADDDVLSLSGGTVTWKTCCGDKLVGSYSRSSGGTWLWQDVWETKNPKTNVCILHPGVFSLTCIDTKRPERVWTLKRRLFPPRSIDADEN